MSLPAIVLCHKRPVDRARGDLKIQIIHADNDVQLTGTLIDQPHVHARFHQRVEQPRGNALGAHHAATHRRNQRQTGMDLHRVRRTKLVNALHELFLLALQCAFMHDDAHRVDAAGHMLKGNILLFQRLKQPAAKADFRVHHRLFHVDDSEIRVARDARDGVFAFVILRLVADDRVDIYARDEMTLWGEPAEILRHLLEIRGVGIIDVMSLYGASAVKDSSQVQIAVYLENYAKDQVYDRLGNNAEELEIGGVTIPRIRIPVKTGRNISVVIEAAAMNVRAKEMGYDATKTFEERLSQLISQNEVKE